MKTKLVKKREARERERSAECVGRHHDHTRSEGKM
jgi:hypothetical protein